MEEGPLITGVEVTASVKQLLWQTPMDGCDCPDQYRMKVHQFSCHPMTVYLGV